MDAAMDVGEKRAILQSIGPNVLVIERKIVKKLAPILSKGLTNALQGEIGAKNDLYSFWLDRQDYHPRPVAR